MKKHVIRLISVVTLIVTLFLLFTGCASWKRELKSIGSDFTGGLNRTITVYDYNGNEIKSWTGKIDLSESENEIFFDDENGKRVIIHGGIVICEEN